MADLRPVLAGWDLPPILAIVPIDGHPVYRVETAGPPFLLKEVAGAPDLGRLATIALVLDHVARTGVGAPAPLPAGDGRRYGQAAGRTYLLYPWIEAGAGADDPQQERAQIYAIGAAMARLHSALAAYADEQIHEKTWRRSLAGDVAGWIAGLCDRLPAAQAAAVRAVAQARQGPIEAALAGLPCQLIHGDCQAGNVLVDGRGDVWFVDWDDLCIGPCLFDLATYAAHRLKLQAGGEAMAQAGLVDLPALCRGYNAEHPLSAAERAALPAAMMAYHLLLAHWRLGMDHWAQVQMELQALSWLHRHYGAVEGNLKW